MKLLNNRQIDNVKNIYEYNWSFNILINYSMISIQVIQIVDCINESIIFTFNLLKMQ